MLIQPVLGDLSGLDQAIVFFFGCLKIILLLLSFLFDESCSFVSFVIGCSLWAVSEKVATVAAKTGVFVVPSRFLVIEHLLVCVRGDHVRVCEVI